MPNIDLNHRVAACGTIYARSFAGVRHLGPRPNVPERLLAARWRPSRYYGEQYVSPCGNMLVARSSESGWIAAERFRTQPSTGAGRQLETLLGPLPPAGLVPLALVAPAVVTNVPVPDHNFAMKQVWPEGEQLAWLTSVEGVTVNISVIASRKVKLSTYVQLAFGWPMTTAEGLPRRAMFLGDHVRVAGLRDPLRLTIRALGKLCEAMWQKGWYLDREGRTQKFSQLASVHALSRSGGTGFELKYPEQAGRQTYVATNCPLCWQPVLGRREVAQALVSVDDIVLRAMQSISAGVQT